MIRRDRSSPTGLSLRAGDPVAVPADLPEHRVEIHAFVDDDAAAGFVAGLELAGNPNRIAWTWEPGSREDNRTVLVARLDEPRPDGDTVEACLPRVEHPACGHDSRDYQASLRRLYAERERGDRADAERLAPLREALRAAGMGPGNGAGMSGSGWLRVGDATLTLVPEGVAGEFHDREDHGDGPEIVERCRVEAARAGFARGERRGEYAGGPYATPAEAAAAVLAFRDLVPRLDAVRREVHHAAFMAGMKVTAARRRFLASAAESGISVWTSRNDLQAQAGAERIKASEINRLKAAGWIRATGRGLEVTPEGLEAAGIATPAPAGP